MSEPDRLRIIDPETGKVLFDSDSAIPEQLDPERDHVVAGTGWQLKTREQIEREIERPLVKDCPTCEGVGFIGKPTETFPDTRCPTCLGGLPRIDDL